MISIEKDSPEDPVLGFLSQWFSGLFLSFVAAKIGVGVRDHVKSKDR